MKYITLLMIVLAGSVLLLNKDNILARYSNSNLAQTSGATYPDYYNLTIKVNGSGKVTYGTQTVTTSQTFSVKKGSTVNLLASRNLKSYFYKWNQSCSGTSVSCAINMSSDKTVEAVFRTTEKICSKESIDQAMERVSNNNSLTSEQKRNQLQDLNDSILYFGCTW